MRIPNEIRAGDTVKWRDDPSTDVYGNVISSSNGWTLTYYLRFNKANHGATVVGTAYGAGWEFTLSQATTLAFDEGDGFWQAEASKAGEHITLGAGPLEVLPSLSYTGNPGAFDGRSQAQKDLDTVQAAIRSLMTGGAVQEYRIGTRSLKRYDLTDLLALETRLKGEIARENKAAMIANGLGNPHNLFVRFGR